MRNGWMARWGGWLAICLAAGCGAASGTKDQPPVTGAAADVGKHAQPTLQRVSLALNWFPEAEHGGFYAALVHGYYAEEGLDVEIRPGGPKAPVIAQVATGQADFGVDNADKLLLGRAQEADVVAVFAPIQTSPRCIMVHAAAGIESFDDLARQTDFTLAMSPGQPFAQFLKRRLKLDGLRQVPYPGNVSTFLQEKRFGQQAYSFSEPFVAKQGGADPKLLMVSDLGFNTYTSVLIAPANRIAKDPDLVQRLVRASARGWRKYLAEPQPTNDHIHQQNPEMGLDVLAFGVEALRPLCAVDEGAPFGAMTAERWDALVRQMTEAGSLDPGQVRPEQAFTTQFLQDAALR